MTLVGAFLFAWLFGQGTPSPDLPSHDEWQALSRDGQDGLYRLAHAGTRRKEPLFQLNGTGRPQTAAEWLAVETGLGPGFYFFESVDGSSPQGGGGELTPPIRLRCRGGSGLAISGFAYFNAERVTCRCWRRRAVDPLPRVADDGLPRAHALGVIYNEGDLVLSGGFRLVGSARAGGELLVRDRAEILADPNRPVPPRRSSFPPAQWKVEVTTPTSWPNN